MRKGYEIQILEFPILYKSLAIPEKQNLTNYYEILGD